MILAIIKQVKPKTLFLSLDKKNILEKNSIIDKPRSINYNQQKVSNIYSINSFCWVKSENDLMKEVFI